MWRTGLGGTANSKTKSHGSYDSASILPHSQHDERDDAESVHDNMDWLRDEMLTMDSYDDKMVKFDEVMNRIEAERRNNSATSDVPFTEVWSNSSLNQRKSSSKRRTSSSAYDFASRAIELKMSDEVASMPGNMRNGRRSTPGRLTPTRRSPSVLRDHEYIARSAGNAPVRSISPARSSSPQFPPPYIFQEGFKAQMKKYQKNLVDAYDTITTLEGEVHDLKENVNEKDNSILFLNQTITTLEKDADNLKRRVDEKDDLIVSLNVTITATRDELGKLEVERETIREEKEADHMKYINERQDFDEKIAGVTEEKAELVNCVKDKETMIDSLRQEIQRLNDELEDGYIVRSQALEAEETAKTMKEKLDKSKEKLDDFDRRMAKKDEIIATLQADIRQNAEDSKSKAWMLDLQLEKSNQINTMLTDKIKNIEKRLEEAESSVLESKTREKDLSRQLEAKQSELQHQRERFERYEKNCAREQDTVTALEEALEKLDYAHGERTTEIARLNGENQRLSKNVAEAVVYMEMYEKDLKESRKLKVALEELQSTNNDLGTTLHDKDDMIGKLESHIALLEKQSESITSSTEKELQQLRQRLQEKDQCIEAFQSRIAMNKETEPDALSTEAILKLTNRLSGELAEKEGLVAQLRESEKLEAINSNLVREFRELEVINVSLRTEIMNITSSNEKELRQLRHQLQEKDQCIEAFQSHIATIEMGKVSDAVSTEAILKLTNELSRELAEKEGLVAQLRESEKLEAINSNLNKELQNKVDEMNKLKNINDSVDLQLHRRDEEVGKLKTRLTSFAASSKEAIVELTGLVAEKEKKIIQLQGELHIKPRLSAKDILNLRKVDVLKASYAENEDDLKRYQEEASMAWDKVAELEKSMQDLTEDRHFFFNDDGINKLSSELASVKNKLAERDEQLAESRKSIAEAQKMIFRLMETIKELRAKLKRRKGRQLDLFAPLIVAQSDSSRDDSQSHHVR
jgi:chromosome segregation protein